MNYLRNRLKSIYLELSEDKTNLMEINSKSEECTFNFLGFEHTVTEDNQGEIHVNRITREKKMTKKL